MENFGISFSWKLALDITSAKQKFARQTGIPTISNGIERKVGKTIINLILSLFGGKK